MFWVKIFIFNRTLLSNISNETVVKGEYDSIDILIFK